MASDLNDSTGRFKVLGENLNQILNRSQGASLVAVSKTKPASDIRFLYEAGQKAFGENKVQELEEKAGELIDLDIDWHFIGNLQTNKVKKLLSIPNLRFIHSISSIKLAEEIAKRVERPLKVFIQINTSGEKEKGGFESEDLSSLKTASSILEENKNIELHGLMTIGSIRNNNFHEAAIQSFNSLKTIRDALDSKLKLSMGMSNDFEIAIECGSDFVRVGSLIFGAR